MRIYEDQVRFGIKMNTLSSKIKKILISPTRHIMIYWDAEYFLNKNICFQHTKMGRKVVIDYNFRYMLWLSMDYCWGAVRVSDQSFFYI
jgi:hypothetical protein